MVDNLAILLMPAFLIIGVFACDVSFLCNSDNMVFAEWGENMFGKHPPFLLLVWKT